MAEASVVGSTRVTVIPDTSSFGDRLRVALPAAIRDPARAAGDVAGDLIASQIRSKMARLSPTVKVGVQIDDTGAKAQLRTLGAATRIKISVQLDDAAARVALDRLAAKRTATVEVEVDDAAAKQKLSLFGRNATVNIVPKVVQAAFEAVERKLEKLCRDRNVNIRPVVDTRVAADELANLVRRRRTLITAEVNTAAARARLDALTRDRTMHVNANVNTSQVSQLTGALAGAGSALSLLGSKAGLLVAAVPLIGALGNVVAAIAPAAALAIPAVVALGSAFGAIKLGTSGIGDALKAAFAPADSAKAVKSADGVASAERAVKQAVEQVGVARENAASANQAAARSVMNAERDLTGSQVAARQAQQDLTTAREEAVQNLRDLNAQLTHSALDERSATLAVQQAQEDLYKVLADPKASELQRQQSQLTYDEAVQNLADQKQKQADLTKEVAAANKAGVEGSKGVVAAKQAEATAQQDVKDKEQAISDARTAQTKTARDGARSIAQAQQAVADAQDRVASAQATATASTSKLNDAMAKLSPNARGFVHAVQGLKPAWDAMKLGVQDKLFAGIGSRLSDVGGRVIPILRGGLEKTAGVLNDMGKSALDAVDKLAKTGMLKTILDGAAKSLKPLSKVPGQVITGFGQIAVAAQPAFQRLTEGVGGVVTKISDKLTKSFKSGQLTKVIDGAVKLFGDLMDIAGDVFDILGNIFDSGYADGGLIAVLKTITGELSKAFASKEVKAGLSALFQVMGTLAKTVAPLLGKALKVVGSVFEKLGPPVTRLIDKLGKALGPIIDALAPVLGALADTFGIILDAVAPLFPVLADLIVLALKPLKPILQVINKVFKELSPSIKPIIDGLGKALTPVIKGLADVLVQMAGQWGDLAIQLIKELAPHIPEIVDAFVQIGKSLGDILTQLAPLIPQILLLTTTFIVQLLPALLPLIGPLTKLTLLLTQLAVAVIEKIVIPSVAKFVTYMTSMKKRLQPWIDIIGNIVKTTIDLFRKLYDVLVGHSIIPDLVRRIRDWFETGRRWVRDTWNSLWANTIGRVTSAAKTLGGKISSFASAVGDRFGDAKRWAVNAWGDMWGYVASKVSSARKTVEGRLSAFKNNSISFFKGAVDGIRTAWARLADAAKTPVRFLIQTVFNKGMVGVWNATAAKLPGIGKMKTMSLPKGFARGGVLPGTSSYRHGDDQLVPMRRGEGVYVSEAMKDPYERARLFAVNQAAMRGQNLRAFRGLRGFSDGGILGNAWNAITDNPVAHTVTDAVKGVINKGADFARDGFAGLAKTAFTKLLGPLTSTAGSHPTWTGMIKAIPLSLANKAISFIKGKEATSPAAFIGKYEPGAGVKQWTSVVLQALKMVNQPASLLNTVLRRMNQESGGNPRAINNWDINAQHGDPSRGLMQTIGSTFNAYAGSLRSRGIYDPLANIYASFKYALSRYGSLASAFNRPGGYAKGGFPSTGELAWVGEEGPELVRFMGPAQVYPHQESVRMASSMGGIPGFAKGGTISATGKGSIAAVIGKSFLDGLEGTSTAIKNAVAKVATAIKNAFKGVNSTVDNRLLASLSATSAKLQTLSTQQAKIAATIATAKQFATDQTAAGQSFTALTSLPNSGLSFDAAGIQNGLNVRLGQLNAFSANLGKLAKLGLSKELLQQIIQAGPDSGAAYAQALVNATPAQLKSINATQTAIDKASSSYGNSAADALYDAGSKAGQGFLAGLTAQEKDIENAMSSLAKKIQAAIKKALKIKSPSRVFAELGSFTVQGFAQGMREATPQAAAAASRMAAVVRSTASATGTPIANTSTTNTSGDRVLNYSATTREVASRQSVLAALAIDDMLHRPAMIGS